MVVDATFPNNTPEQMVVWFVDHEYRIRGACANEPNNIIGLENVRRAVFDMSMIYQRLGLPCGFSYRIVNNN